MGKASKTKREETPTPAKAEEGDGYEFKLPKFDERAFIRREVLSAKASFYTVGLGFAAGGLALVLQRFGGSWQLGWIPLILSMAFLKPILERLGFPEDVTTWKALIGSFFMLFFTGLAVWMLGVNFL